MKPWWDLWWRVQSARINALRLRERVFLFLSVIAICMALIDGVWLSPAQVAHKQLTESFDKQSAELQRARDELKFVAKPADASQALRDEIAAVKITLDTVNQTIVRHAEPPQASIAPSGGSAVRDATSGGTIKGLSSVATEATPLVQVLSSLVRRHKGLALLRISAVASEAAMGKADQAVKAVGAGAALLPVELTRQGVELTVSGPYHELIRYVQALENELPYVRWGRMQLKSEKPPPELRLQLFLLGE